jgi:hypothetical protein
LGLVDGSLTFGAVSLLHVDGPLMEIHTLLIIGSGIQWKFPLEACPQIGNIRMPLNIPLERVPGALTVGDIAPEPKQWSFHG